MIGPWLARWLRWPQIRALRGATTVAVDDASSIHTAVLELLHEMERRNSLRHGEVISAIFTMTPDLSAAFPAEAVRLAGWHDVPLLCTSEIAVPGGLPRCLRILLHVERPWRSAPVPVYLREAITLRPDLLDPVEGERRVAFPDQQRQHPPQKKLVDLTHSR